MASTAIDDGGDLRRSWLSVARRLQDVACRVQSGVSILSISVVVNSDGDAVVWTAPTETRIEPGKSAQGAILELLSSLSGKDRSCKK